MPSNRRTINEYFEPEPSRKMGSLEAKNGLKKQQNSKTVKEPARLPQGNKGNVQGTVKSSGDCSGQCVTRTAAKNDELVRHMSNLPGYLQRVGKQENIQEKALNVGVLDWGRLQNWKHKQSSNPGRGGSNISSKSSSLSQKTTAKSFSLPSMVSGDTQANKRKQLELGKKELQHSETDEKRSGPLWLRTSALPITVSEDTLSDKSKELEVRKKKMQNSDTDDSKHLPGELKNIALLLPKRSARYSSTLEKPPELLDKNLTKAKSPDDFIQKSEKPHSEIPHSCPLPTRVECDSETDLIAEGLELLSDASRSAFNSNNKGNIPSLSKCKEQKKAESENASNETSKILDQEMAELANMKNRRNQSSHHRFSFSFSQMGRSFSFKEGPVVQRLSSYVSVKSGPVKSGAAVCLDDSSREKVKYQNRIRSSSVRRMLAPLLGPKSLNSLSCTEILQPLEGSLNCSDSWPTASESFKKDKHEPSTIQALLQLTLKDGLPLFRFVVNNSSNILVATMKMPSSGDMGQNYTFYSVNEVKKKIGSWLSQGSKEKSCGYACDIIGEMKISSSHISNVKDSNYQNLIRESVLFGVDYRQETQASQKVTCNIELAAVVVKMPKEDFIHGVQKSCKDATKRGFTESLQKDGCCFNFTEKEASNSTIVILPGGTHNLPNKGLPSPLIHRWRSGGSCDCGGWDVGCKLRILSNQNVSSNNQMTCQAYLNAKGVKLFVQDETQQIRPVFSLAPHKHGLYTIEFDSTISTLQAFFISVTVICCQKSSILLEVNNPSSEKIFKESVLKGSDRITTLLGKMPAKYAPNPPLSPFGRV